MLTSSMNLYLEEKGLVDTSNVKNISCKLTRDIASDVEKARVLYEYVRDVIRHSADINENLLTKSASDVLKHGHGICFTKSILLVAMLRSIDIPAGFGYQKIILDDELYPWLVLHGYVFIYLESIRKWIKVDARGNKPGVNAEFSIGKPVMAFEIRKELGETDQDINHPYPVDSIVKCLESNETREELWKNLPSEF